MCARITVVGAGSGYMPGVIRGLLHRAADLAGAELVFHDIDAGHLGVMTRLARGMFRARGADLTVRAETSLKAALDGADFVFTTFRPGGLPARHLDESIPLKYGVVGQETIGPGVAEALARTARMLRDDADALDGLAARAYDELLDDAFEHSAEGHTVAIRVDGLEELHRAVRTRVLRMAAVKAGSPPGTLAAVHVDAVDRLVTAWHGQRQVDLPGGLRAFRRYGRLLFGPV